LPHKYLKLLNLLLLLLIIGYIILEKMMHPGIVTLRDNTPGSRRFESNPMPLIISGK
jgi:hypothetical protein